MLVEYFIAEQQGQAIARSVPQQFLNNRNHSMLVTQHEHQ